MRKVITYGTFDLLHEGHVNILKRAKGLGDYLIVGVTTDEYDLYRGKLNVSQTVAERISALEATGLADKIIVEDYEGQKIEDIRKYGVDVIALGSDWAGKIDYLKKYCEVVYFPRTPNVSSTLLRTRGKVFNLGMMCDHAITEDLLDELGFVSGLDLNCLYSPLQEEAHRSLCEKFGLEDCSGDLAAFCRHSDVVYADMHSGEAFNGLRTLITGGKHVLASHSCGLTAAEMGALRDVARERGVAFLAAAPFRSLTAYNKLVNIALSGSLGALRGTEIAVGIPGSALDLATLERILLPLCLLPIVQLFGWETQAFPAGSAPATGDGNLLVVHDLRLGGAFAHVKIAQSVPLDGHWVIYGDSAYVEVPAPWWEADYFELRKPGGRVKKFSWPRSGAAVRYHLAAFAKLLSRGAFDVPEMDSTIRVMRLAESLGQGSL